MAFVGEQPITRRRAASTEPSFDAEGYLAPLVYTDTAGRATVNPVPGEEAVAMGYGDHLNDLVKIICAPSFDLRADDDTADVAADLVVWESKTYRIVRVRRYTRVIPHLEAVGVRTYE